jgi:hypothetical protein
MAEKKILAGEEFTDLSIALTNRILELCEATYKASKKPSSKANLEKLIATADAQVAEYRELSELYTGGRRESIRKNEHDIKLLQGFVDTLKKSLGK